MSMSHKSELKIYKNKIPFKKYQTLYGIKIQCQYLKIYSIYIKKNLGSKETYTTNIKREK